MATRSSHNKEKHIVDASALVSSAFVVIFLFAYTALMLFLLPHLFLQIFTTLLLIFIIVVILHLYFGYFTKKDLKKFLNSFEQNKTEAKK